MSSFEAVLKDPDQFIAAVPAMLGFVPERSLVVVALHHEAGQRYAVKVAVPAGRGGAPDTRSEGLLAHLKQQFKDALSSIEPGDDKTNAPEAHRLVRDALEADTVLAGYGVNDCLLRPGDRVLIVAAPAYSRLIVYSARILAAALWSFRSTPWGDIP
ncbi:MULTISPECIES: DUF4192 family protein [unclassified Nocardia]|uniref:DUF4192 family protein n=1 Tax=unclassified Nocardia TaxID=2637762 RepID=UPI0024A9BE02|nr:MULTISPECIES: DUF4192 family protein [unclassified Nocardia]